MATSSSSPPRSAFSTARSLYGTTKYKTSYDLDHDLQVGPAPGATAAERLAARATLDAFAARNKGRQASL